MATRFFLNIGTAWNDNANWSDSTGGSGGFSFPTAVDNAIFDSNSGSCTLTAVANCLALKLGDTLSDYTGRLALAFFNLNVDTLAGKSGDLDISGNLITSQGSVTLDTTDGFNFHNGIDPDQKNGRIAILSGVLTLQGKALEDLEIDNLDFTMSAGVTSSADLCAVLNSQATGDSVITATNSIDHGGNTGWSVEPKNAGALALTMPTMGMSFAGTNEPLDRGAVTFGKVTKIVAADSPYQASDGEIIECDCSAGAITVLAPAFGILGKTFTVKKIDDTINFATITATAIESKTLDAIGTQALLWDEFETITWYTDQTSSIWRILSAARLSDYAEAFTLASAPVLVSGTTVLQWTFAPLFPGQTQVLTSQSVGVFTSLEHVAFSLTVDVLYEFSNGSNNWDATGSVDMVFSGSGAELFIPSIVPFSHTRTKQNPGFFATGNARGAIDAIVNDTFRFDANNDAAQSGVTEIAEAILTMRIG